MVGLIFIDKRFEFYDIHLIIKKKCYTKLKNIFKLLL